MDRSQQKLISVEPEDEAAIVGKAEAAQRRGRAKSASVLFRNVGTLIRLLRDPGHRIAWPTRALILGALAYFLLPTDATPDYIPFVGYVDDTVVVGLVIKRLAREIERYKSRTL